MLLHPIDGLQKAKRPVRRVGLEQDLTVVSQRQTERGAHTQLAEKDVLDPRSETSRAKGVEVSDDPHIVHRGEDGPREDSALA